MKAIILAAGYGSRLGHHTSNKPKSLVDTNGLPLLVRNLFSLQRAGVNEAHVVVGHFGDQVIEEVSNYFDNQFLRFIVNDNYSLGSATSLKAASNILTDKILIIEGDLLFHQLIAERIMSEHVDNCFAMGTYENDRTEGQLLISDGFVTGISWDIASSEYEGEWVGITKLSRNASLDLQESLASMPNVGLKNEFQYSDYIFQLIERHSFQAISIDDLPWIEIDTDEDLKRATSIIVPNLENISLYRTIRNESS